MTPTAKGNLDPLMPAGALCVALPSGANRPAGDYAFRSRLHAGYHPLAGEFFVRSRHALQRLRGNSTLPYSHTKRAATGNVTPNT
jgi:hypothetical protein